jgi:hypothetical protein
MTKTQLKKFISMRNKSSLTTNLQFAIDANECGFYATELGDAKKIDDGYCWNTPHGTLVERHGRLELLPK